MDQRQRLRNIFDRFSSEERGYIEYALSSFISREKEISEKFREIGSALRDAAYSSRKRNHRYD